MELRSTWTDSRLDDLSGRVDRVHQDITELRAEMNLRFDSLQASILRFGGALVLCVVGTLLAFVLGVR
jgi:hypothetical protein